MLDAAGNADGTVMVASLDADGATRWGVAHGDRAIGAGRSVAADGEGHAYVAGVYISSHPDNPISFGGDPIGGAETTPFGFVVKLSDP